MRKRKRAAYTGCYIRHTHHRENDMEHFRATVTFNEYLIKTALDYWAALAFPAIHLAKYL